jgi:hypothetical protein
MATETKTERNLCDRIRRRAAKNGLGLMKHQGYLYLFNPNYNVIIGKFDNPEEVMAYLEQPDEVAQS